MKKMNKADTKEYINLQLPIIKGELQQVTNKINTFISVFATALAFLLTNIIFIVPLLQKDTLYWIIFVILIFFLVLTMSFLIIYSIKRKSKDKKIIKKKIEKRMRKIKKKTEKRMRKIKKKTEKLNFNSSIKDIDPYYYRSYTKVSLKAYLKMFSWDDLNDKYALEQIYMNSMNIIFKSGN